MTRIFTDDRENRAALILSGFSLDIIKDIIALAQSRGPSLASQIVTKEGLPPRPFVLLSNDYVNAADFPEVWTGLMTVMLHDARKLKADKEYYAKVISTAFSLPDTLVKPLADKIETYDAIGGRTSEVDDQGNVRPQAWYKNWLGKFSEVVRRIVNVPANLLGTDFLYNDQSQEGDLDYLYELSLLGQVVSDLSKRARLVLGQAKYARVTGALLAGDPSDTLDADAYIMSVATPAMGAPLPRACFGGMGDVAEKGAKLSLANLLDMLRSAGVITDPLANREPNAALKQSISGYLTGAPKPVAYASGLPTESEHRALNVLMNQPSTDATYSLLAEEWGSPVANAWAEGDIPGAMRAIVKDGQDYSDVPSTGDPELDGAIIADLDKDLQTGDPADHDVDAELGFPFLKSKRKRALKKKRKEFADMMEHRLKMQAIQREMENRYRPETPYATEPGMSPAWPPYPADMAAQEAMNYNAGPVVDPVALNSMGVTGLPGGGNDLNMLTMFPESGL